MTDSGKEVIAFQIPSSTKIQGFWFTILATVFYLTYIIVLLPFIALQMYFHSLIWVAALWAITFPGSTGALAILFQRAATVAPVPSNSVNEM